MTDPRTAALDWIRSALAEEFPSRDVEATAEEMHAIAIDYGVPVEEAVRWIHSRERGSIADWAHHCVYFSELQRRYGTPQQEALFPANDDAGAFDPK